MQRDGYKVWRHEKSWRDDVVGVILLLVLALCIAAALAARHFTGSAAQLPVLALLAAGGEAAWLAAKGQGRKERVLWALPALACVAVLAYLLA